jgi:hypothetical protein
MQSPGRKSWPTLSGLVDQSLNGSNTADLIKAKASGQTPNCNPVLAAARKRNEPRFQGLFQKRKSFDVRGFGGDHGCDIRELISANRDLGSP